uniref:ATP-grasp domain-containing protein n=1 Tax=Ornithorhynchus anatinus TaxID=9258 RepID=F7AHP0_ORNAN
MSARVLVIGNGGREHTLAWKLAQSPHVKQVLVAPGNAGTADAGKITNSAVLASNHTILAQFCKDHNIGLVVVGSGSLLAAGIVDDLTAAGVRCFGPTAKAARLEASKKFAKEFMDRHGIPTARWKAFTDSHEACDFIGRVGTEFPALVVKTGGPCARDARVIVAASREEACQVARELMQSDVFGESEGVVMVEELLKGEEISCFCFSDGVASVAMPIARSQRRLLDGDLGPITGGMGAYCPAPKISEEVLKELRGGFLQHIIDSMKREGAAYIGILQVGIMLTESGMKVLNFKCCFSDPECQVILPLLQNDLYDVIQATLDGRLRARVPVWREDRAAVALVLASEGYPGDHVKGSEITGLLEPRGPGLEVFHSSTALRDGTVVTDGGRVLVVTAVGEDLASALAGAREASSAIRFPGATFRRDIGRPAADGTEGLREITPSWKAPGSVFLIFLDLFPADGQTEPRDEVLAGVFELKAAGYQSPVLVSRTRSIGPKIKIAQLCNKHDTIGHDVVAACVNDVLAQGAEPLFFLCHLTQGKLGVRIREEIHVGLREACEVAGCKLLGGEMSEEPGTHSPGEFEPVGFAVGAVERGQLLPQTESIVAGDVVIGVASSGLHCSGFGLVRKLVEVSSLCLSSPAPSACRGQTLGQLLLTPTRIYCRPLLPVLRSGRVKALAHITGGGLLENIPRVLPDKLGVQLDARRWRIPTVFSWLQYQGRLSEDEMARNFNCGIGAILVVQEDLAEQVLREVQRHEEEAWLIGSVVPRHEGASRFEVKNLSTALRTGHGQVREATALEESPLQDRPPKSKVRVAVLLSGAGPGLGALIALGKEPACCVQTALVISNKPGVRELREAALAGIPTRVIDHTLFGSRKEFDGTIDKVLKEFSIEVVGLAGFTRILSGPFLRKWNGKILDIYPSLSPSVQGRNVRNQERQAGDKLPGCTVRFLLEEAGTGAVILQEPVKVEAGDTEEALSIRVKETAGRAFPFALQLVASGAVRLGGDGKVSWEQGVLRQLPHLEKSS